MPELYSGAPERLTRIDPELLAGGEGSDLLLLAVLAYNEARLGRDRARCVALAERALRGSTLEEGASFGLYYALLAMGFAGELETATAIWNRALGAARRRGDLLTTLSTLTWRGFCALRRGELRTPMDVPRAWSSVTDGLSSGDAYTRRPRGDPLLERGEFAEAESVLGDRGLGERFPRTCTSHSSSPHAGSFTSSGAGLSRRLQTSRRPARSPAGSTSTIPRTALGARTPRPRCWRLDGRRLAEEELDLARRWNEPRAIGIGLRAVASACGGREQECWLREAVDVLSMSSARLEHAKALVELGRGAAPGQ